MINDANDGLTTIFSVMLNEITSSDSGLLRIQSLKSSMLEYILA